MKRSVGWLCFAVFVAPITIYGQGGYGGPSILGRGGTLTRSSGEGNLINLRPFLSVHGTYNKGLTPAGVDSEGNVPDRASYGLTGVFGAVGDHAWKRSVLSMSYMGRYRHYSRQKNQDGIDQTMALGFAHQLSRRVVLSLTEAAGTYSRGMGLIGLQGMGGFNSVSLVPTDPTLEVVPSDDIVDTRTYYVSSGADLSFRKSARLSFSMGATGFLTERRAVGLAGVKGFMARGDVSYMVARNHVVGIDYMFGQYNFTKAFGDSTIHGAAVNYSTRFARRWTFGVRGGMFRLEVQRVGQVSLDPLVAAILGQRTGLEILHRVRYNAMGNVHISRSFRRYSVSMSYARRVVPGNGVYLTSINDTVSGHLGYSGLRRWSIGFGGGYSRMSARMQTASVHNGVHGRASAGVRIVRSLHFQTTYSIRQYQIGSNFHRTSYTVSAGLAFAPGKIPLSFW